MAGRTGAGTAGGSARGRVLILGASGGIGGAVARRFAQRGARLVLSGRRSGALHDLARDCARAAAQVHVLTADLGDQRQAEALAERAHDLMDGCDTVVSAAGIPRRVHAARLAPDDLRVTMQVNYLGPATVMLGALPPMLAGGDGALVAVGSLAGRLPTPREAAYAASKHALAAWMDTLAMDLRGTGVGVHVVSPAVVDTPLWSVPEQEEAAVAGRGIAPAAVADAVLRLVDRGTYEVFVPARHRLTAVLAAAARRPFISAASRFDRARVPRAHR